MPPSWFSYWSSVLIELKFGDVGFSGIVKWVSAQNPKKVSYMAQQISTNFTMIHDGSIGI